MELMKEAGLNTLLGMGMTFLVLISLSLIISVFGKVLSGTGKKKAAPSGAKKAPAPAPAPAAAVTKSAPAAEKSAVNPEDDPVLIAVITAAVAAYESGEVAPEVVAAIAAAIAQCEAGKTTGTPSAGGFSARRVKKSRKHVA